MKTFTPLFVSAVLINFSVTAQTSSENTQTGKVLSFKENKGQVSDQFYHPRTDVLFSGSTEGLVFHLKNNGISYQLNRVDEWEKKVLPGGRTSEVEPVLPLQTTIYRVDINWLNANPSPEIIKGKVQAGYENYYGETCPHGALEVRSYADITYNNIYPGIDLKWYEKNSSLEYDLVVAAHSDPSQIQFEFKGAESIYVDNTGALIINTPLGTIKEQKPLVTQNNKMLVANWQVINNIVSFDIKNVNADLPLLIDPVVKLWATYYGGPAYDDVFYTYANSTGEVFISGSSVSLANIASSGAHQTTFGGGSPRGDGFVVKFDPTGVRLWATYYGGSANDYAGECVADGSGNVFMTGFTQSGSAGVIATPGAHQTLYSIASTNIGDAFLVAFNAAGVRQWGTYYGGDAEDIGNGIALDNSGNIFICGASRSGNNISTGGSYQAANAAGQDCFLAKFNAAGVRQWGTYYGGNSLNEISSDCVTNSAGDVYITGSTSSSVGISTPGSHQPVYGGGPTNGAGDAYLAKFNAAGVCQWATYYGGTASDYLNRMAVDGLGDVYAAGWTSSSNGTSIATPGSHQSAFGGNQDAFLVKFSPAGIRQWGTYYGGTGSDYAGAPSVDASGNVYVTGDASTVGGTTIATPCAYQQNYAGGSSDAFFAKFTTAGQRLWGSYYGSASTELSYSSHCDGLGNIYVSGFSYANSGTVLATSSGHQPNYGGGTADGFLVKFDGCNASSAVNLTPASNLMVCPGKSTTLTASCGNWYSSATGTTVISTGGTFNTGIITADTTFYVEDFGCGSITGTRTAISITLATLPTLTVTNSNPAACVTETILLSAMGASTYVWANNSATTSAIQVYVLLYTTYSVTGTDANGCKSTATLVVDPNLCIGIQERGGPNPAAVVYPNPNKGAFTVQANSTLNFIFIDELGRTVKEISLTPSNNYTGTVDKLESGVYFLTGEKGSGVTTKKIVVIH